MVNSSLVISKGLMQIIRTNVKISCHPAPATLGVLPKPSSAKAHGKLPQEAGDSKVGMGVNYVIVDRVEFSTAIVTTNSRPYSSKS